MAMRGTRSTSRGQDSGKKPGEQRTRSASRRRRIEAEVAARRQRERDAFQLQKEMVTPGVGDALMQAAKQLFQAEDYKAIVEERAVEGICGYPPCSHYAAGKPGKKKWKINLRDREVYSQEEIGMFCSFECLQDNARFVASLDVDPGYVRPASAVAAARGAVAAADEARRAGARKRSGSGRRERAGQVKHSDYDGGGGIPEVCQAAAGKKGETTQELVRRLVSAPIVERPEPPQQQPPEQQALEQQAPEQQPTVPKQEGAKAEDADDDARSAATGDAGSDDEADDIGSDADVSSCSSGSNFGDANAKVAPPEGSPFVRAWGVLATWFTPFASEVLHDGREAAMANRLRCSAEEPSDSSDDEPADPLEDLRPPKSTEWKPTPLRKAEDGLNGGRSMHNQRRTVLRDLLSSRIPGDLMYLAPRFDDVSLALGVHHAVPSDSAMCDLLAALLLRALMRAEVRRGVNSPCRDSEAIIARSIDVSARRFLGEDLPAEERSRQVQELEKQLVPWRTYGLDVQPNPAG